jgi:DNA invertase Pin-like site-specific DNA recombinase
MKAAIYARVSTADGRQDTENQLADLRRFAAAQGWEIASEYIDHESGSKADRVMEFRRMFTDAAQRRFDVVLFWALDRLTREGALETLQYLNQLSRYGVGYRSFTESYLDSCGMFREAVIAILGAIAKQERVRISKRVRAGMSRARAHGTRSGRAIGRPKVIFSREEVVQLRKQGKSWRQIARECGAGAATVRRAYKEWAGTDPARDGDSESRAQSHAL